MLRKTIKSGEDQLLALLNIRDLPAQDVDSSPAQTPVGKMTRTLLPTPKMFPCAQEKINAHESEQFRPETVATSITFDQVLICPPWNQVTPLEWNHLLME